MDDRELGLVLLEYLEELYLRVRVQQALLDRLVSPAADWREKAEQAEILNAPKYHQLFDKLRSGMFGLEREGNPHKDWRSMVRKLVDEGEV